jgi:hypothetical protein
VESFFAWHGTPSDENTVSICDGGWDPKRRSGQVYGVGEYFGQDCSVSMGYSKNSGRMIVALLLRVRETTTHGNYCYLVNNPMTGMAFCLPVLVVSYSGKINQINFRETTSLTSQNEVNKTWVAPFRWYWGTMQSSGLTTKR